MRSVTCCTILSVICLAPLVTDVTRLEAPSVTCSSTFLDSVVSDFFLLDFVLVSVDFSAVSVFSAASAAFCSACSILTRYVSSTFCDTHTLAGTSAMPITATTNTRVATRRRTVLVLQRPWMPSDTAKSTSANGIKMPKPTDHKIVSKYFSR